MDISSIRKGLTGFISDIGSVAIGTVGSVASMVFMRENERCERLSRHLDSSRTLFSHLYVRLVGSVNPSFVKAIFDGDETMRPLKNKESSIYNLLVQKLEVKAFETNSRKDRAAYHIMQIAADICNLVMVPFSLLLLTFSSKEAKTERHLAVFEHLKGFGLINDIALLLLDLINPARTLAARNVDGVSDDMNDFFSDENHEVHEMHVTSRCITDGENGDAENGVRPITADSAQMRRQRTIPAPHLNNDAAKKKYQDRRKAILERYEKLVSKATNPFMKITLERTRDRELAALDEEFYFLREDSSVSG